MDSDADGALALSDDLEMDSDTDGALVLSDDGWMSVAPSCEVGGSSTPNSDKIEYSDDEGFVPGGLVPGGLVPGDDSGNSQNLEQDWIPGQKLGQFDQALDKRFARDHNDSGQLLDPENKVWAMLVDGRPFACSDVLLPMYWRLCSPPAQAQLRSSCPSAQLSISTAQQQQQLRLQPAGNISSTKVKILQQNDPICVLFSLALL